MKITIRNFGPIDTIEIDLNKDLHMVFGDNAIGKSYATYCLYCLIKNIKNKSYRRNYYYQRDYESSIFYRLIKGQSKQLAKNKVVDISSKWLEIMEEELSNIILPGLQNSLQNTFSSLKNLGNRFTNKNYEIEISLNKKKSILISSDIDGALSLRLRGLNYKLEYILKDTKTTKYSLYLNGKKSAGKPNEEELYLEFMRFSGIELENILRNLDFNIRDIYYLPASRSGLYQALSAFTPIIAELTQNRFFMRNKSIELPSLSEPLADYFIDLSTVDKKHVNKEFSGLIDMLEKEILRGNVEYDDKTKRILYKPKDVDIELNLSEASSMVAELSPLVLYFRHILNNKYSSVTNRDPFFYDSFYRYQKRVTKNKGYDILFIEEPEAHLHPEIQVKLLSLFIKITKLNIKLVITSHSNYMFNKLNNILIQKGINKDQIKIYHLMRTNKGTIDNHDMNVTEEGINDENFQSVSEKLYFERLESLEKLE